MSQAKRPKSTRPLRYDRTILDLHNGVNTTQSPIVDALWFSDGAFLEGALLLKDKEARGETPTLVEYYCLFLAAIQRNDRKTITASLAAARKHYAAEKLWITSMEGQVGAWSQTDTEAIAMLMESGEPLFQGLACRFQGSRCIKNSQRLQREEASPEAVKAEQLKAAEYFEAGYEYVLEVSLFEACRNKHELAQAYPIERMAEKIACSKEAIELAVKCGAMRYQFTGRDRYSELLRLQAAAEFSDQQKSEYLGKLIRSLEGTRSLEEFGQRAIELLCQESFLRVPKAALTLRHGSASQETVIYQHPPAETLELAAMYEEELGWDCYLRASHLTDSSALRVFVRELRYLLHQGVKTGRINVTAKLKRDEEVFEFMGYKMHGLAWREPYEDLKEAAKQPRDKPILIVGPTGTGKTALGKAIHFSRGGTDHNFKYFNCADLGGREAVTVDARDSYDFFGWTKHAYQGADQAGVPIFEAAGKGTVFLDEVGELPRPVQAQLLSILDDRVFHKKGMTTSVPLECTIILATNRPVLEEGGTDPNDRDSFRADLLYRIETIVRLPPLNDTPLQILYLARKFAEAACQKEGIADGFQFDSEAKLFLLETNWTGNVRMLRSLLLRAVKDYLREVKSPSEIVFSVPLLERAMRNIPRADRGEGRAKGTHARPPVPAPNEPVSFFTELEKLLKVRGELTPAEAHTWATKILAQTDTPGPVSAPASAPVPAPQPEPVTPLLPMGPVEPPLVVQPVPKTVSQSPVSDHHAQPAMGDRRTAYVKLYRELVTYLRTHFKPLRLVVPQSLQPYLLTVEKSGSLPNPQNFAKIKAVFDSPLLQQAGIRETIHQWAQAWHQCQEANTEKYMTPAVVSAQVPQPPPFPAKQTSPAPAMQPGPAIQSKGVLIRDLSALVWELLGEFHYEKSRYFKKETIKSFYSMRTKPYKPNEGVFLDILKGFRNSPLAQSRQDKIERLFHIYCELQEMEDVSQSGLRKNKKGHS